MSKEFDEWWKELNRNNPGVYDANDFHVAGNAWDAAIETAWGRIHQIADNYSAGSDVPVSLKNFDNIVRHAVRQLRTDKD